MRNINQYVSEYRFLQAENFDTMKDIKDYIDTAKVGIAELERGRSLTDNKRCREKTPEEKQQYKDERKDITKQITPLRKKSKQAEQIYDKSPRLLNLLNREYKLERKIYERNR